MPISGIKIVTVYKDPFSKLRGSHFDFFFYKTDLWSFLEAMCQCCTCEPARSAGTHTLKCTHAVPANCKERVRVHAGIKKARKRGIFDVYRLKAGRVQNYFSGVFQLCIDNDMNAILYLKVNALGEWVIGINLQEFTYSKREISIPHSAASCDIENFEFIVNECR